MNWLKSLITKLAQQGSINYLLKSNPSLFKEYQDKKNSIIIPSQYTGESGEILKKWIFYRSKQGDNINLNGLDVVLVNPADKAKTWFTKPDFTFSDLQKKNEEYHEKLKENKNRVYTPKYPITILKQYSNGLAWGRLETPFCGEYGKSLGHCGNAGWGGDYTQRIYTFYDTTTNIHYLTFIYHNDGILGEAKAYGNSKPPIDKIKILNREDLQSIDAQQVYKDLLLLKDKDQYVWNSIRGAGYKPENNFGFQDLNEKNKEEVKKERENIDDYFSYKKGKDSNELYFIENSEIYFKKNITKEEFKDILENNQNDLLSHQKTYQYIVKFNLENDKNILNFIVKFGYGCMYLAKALKFDLNKIPKEVYKVILWDSSLSFNFAEGLNYDLNKIPKEIIESIAKDEENRYNLSLYFYRQISDLKFDLNKISDKLINIISLDGSVSALLAEKLFYIAEHYNFDKNKIPDKLIRIISISPKHCYLYAKELKFDLNKIPDEIINGIAKDSVYSYDFSNDSNINLSDLPSSILESISNDKFYSDAIGKENYTKAMKEKFDLNRMSKETIIGISISPNYSYEFIEKLYNNKFNFNQIPEKITDSIAKSPQLCIRTLILFNLRLNNIPQKFIDTISKDYWLSHQFIRHYYYNLKNIPKEIMDSVFKLPGNCYETVKYFDKTIGLDNLDKEFLNKLFLCISSMPSYSYDIAAYLKFNLTKIPKEIIEGISKDKHYSYVFVSGLDFDLNKIPKIIIDVILKDKNYRLEFLYMLRKRKIEIPEWIENYKTEGINELG